MEKSRTPKTSEWKELTTINHLGTMFNIRHNPLFDDIQYEEKMIELERKPCPNCNGTNIGFTYSTRQGHEGGGFSDGRVQCSDCNLSIGNESDWGSPGLDTRNKLTEMWNNLKR